MFIKQQIIKPLRNYLKQQSHKGQLEYIMNYMHHGVSFEHFEMDCSFDEFIALCFPISAPALLGLLPPLHTLSFLHQYDEFRERLKKDVMASFLYSFVLLGLGIGMSYFFLYQFEPSVRGLLSDHGTDLSSLKRYRILIQGVLFVLNVSVGSLIVVLLMVQSKDLKILVTISLLGVSPFFKKVLSYQYAMMLLLFLQFDMKTSQMVSFLRSASVGDINKWLSYHIESNLDQGIEFSKSLEADFFDTMMIDFMHLGYLHQDVKSYLEQYCALMKEDVRLCVKRYGSIFRVAVFSFLIMIVALFYSTLYMPLQLLEVL